MKQAFSKIWVVILLLALAIGGILAWQYFKTPEKDVRYEVIEGEYNKVLYWVAGEITLETVSTKEKYDFGIYSIDLNGENKKKILEGSESPFPFGREAVKVSASGKMIFLERKSRLDDPKNEMYLWVIDLKNGNKNKIVDIVGDSEITQEYPFIISDDGELVAYSIRTIFSQETPVWLEIKEVHELWIIQSDGTNPRKIFSSETIAKINKENKKTIFSEQGEELIPIEFSADNKKLFTVSKTTYASGPNKPRGFVIIDLETLETDEKVKFSDFPKPVWDRIFISPDKEKIVIWEWGLEKLNKIYLTDLTKNTSITLTEDKNVTVIGWLSNEEVIYESRNIFSPSYPKTIPVVITYKKLNVITKERTNLFSLTQEVKWEKENGHRLKYDSIGSEMLVDKNRLLYRTNGRFSTPASLSELFVINLDGTNKIKLDSVKDGLTIIGLVYLE